MNSSLHGVLLEGEHVQLEPLPHERLAVRLKAEVGVLVDGAEAADATPAAFLTNEINNYYDKLTEFFYGRCNVV